MDGSQIHPRLRLTRRSRSRMHSGQYYDTPGAGPSRLSSDHLGYDLHDDDEDTEATPRLSNGAKLAPEKNSPLSYSHSALHSEATPVSRLRSLLARAKDTPPSRQPEPRSPSRSPSDNASDYDAVNPSLASTSVASQSLRELFSRVLRDSDTPKKPQRRNSIDASEVEDSPRLERVWKERSSYKGKRRSMSDEEAEKSFGEYMSCILGRVVYEHEHPAATRSLPEERSPPSILSRSIRCPTTETFVNLFKVPLFRSYVLFRLPAP